VNVLSKVIADDYYIPHPSDDLEMIVHMLHLQLFPRQLLRLLATRRTQKEQAQDALRFWQQAMAPEFWHELVVLARNVAYKPLINKINQILV
jgi:hypothetical protein